MFNDPLSQVIIVGALCNAAGAAIALYLWNQQRSDRYLLFWAGSWIVGTTRFLIHLQADVSPWLRTAEVAVLFPLLFICNVLGCYDLLPTKPWRKRYVVPITALLLFAYGAVAASGRVPLQMAYGLVIFIFMFDAICLWVAYRVTRLSGHAMAAVTFFLWSGWFFLGLVLLGAALPKSIIGPLFNIPAALSLVVIAYQRRGRDMRGLYVRLANTEDAERRALHRELHDTVGANLSALRLELDVIAGRLARGEQEAAQQHLRSAGEVAAETVDMARDLMANLRPPALDDFGLVSALRSHAETQSLRLGIPIVVVAEDLVPPPGALVESALFRIALEAVINAARHASPQRITITVGERAGRVQLGIEDDGVGFDAQAQEGRPGHWGLQNMRERARAIGATLEIRTAPQAGTRILVDAPREAA
ncbi:MAG: sensor histidine kinase [Ramlibacter sp.]|nr:sensor histidine kinase [Ramlibacter sp.]